MKEPQVRFGWLQSLQRGGATAGAGGGLHGGSTAATGLVGRAAGDAAQGRSPRWRMGSADAQIADESRGR